MKLEKKLVWIAFHISNEVIGFVSNKKKMITKNLQQKKIIHISTDMEECRKRTYLMRYLFITRKETSLFNRVRVSQMCL